MVHYISFFRIPKGKSEEEIEEMIRISRTCFHRVNEAHNFRSGRSIDDVVEYGFFISADFDNREKVGMFRDDPNYRRFKKEVIDEHTTEQIEYLFETEPGKDPKYS